MKILAKEWRSGIDTVGIILIENEEGELSARMGACKRIFFSDDEDIEIIATQNEAADARYIAEQGCKLSFSEAKAFFPFIKEEKYKKS